MTGRAGPGCRGWSAIWAPRAGAWTTERTWHPHGGEVAAAGRGRDAHERSRARLAWTRFGLPAKMRGMNTYGQRARDHWSRTDPARYRAIEDPETFFQTLGVQVEARIQDLTADLAGPDPVGEGYLAKVGRLNMARLRAEEVVVSDLVLIPAPLTGPGSDAQEDPELSDSEHPMAMVSEIQSQIDADRESDQPST
jgi:hypothetical protein